MMAGSYEDSWEERRASSWLSAILVVGIDFGGGTMMLGGVRRRGIRSAEAERACRRTERGATKGTRQA